MTTLNFTDWIELEYGFQYPDSYSDFDHLTQEDYDSLPVFKYRDSIWSLEQFIKVCDNPDYHAVMGLTNTSALALRLSDSGDAVQVAVMT